MAVGCRVGVVQATIRSCTSFKSSFRSSRTAGEVLLYEVMVAELERDWWTAYRKELEGKFHQQEIVIRAHLIERL